METARKQVYTTHIAIRWGDMDAAGHVNNTVYFRYAEQARIEWMESLGLLSTKRDEITLILVSASCDFRIPLVYPGTVEVRVYLGPLGRSSLRTSFDMRLPGEDRIYAEGTATLVWINRVTGKSVPMPDSMRRLAEAELAS